MTPAFSITATPSTAILRVSVVLVLLPLALGFAPAISTMHLSASGNRRALTASSPSLPRVTAGPLAVTMLDSHDRLRIEAIQREHASRRAMFVLRTAAATLATVFVLGIARPASAMIVSMDGGADGLPAMVSTGLSKYSRVDARVAVPQDFKKTTRQELMAMEVKAKHPSFTTTRMERFRDLTLKVIFFGASLLVVPWYALGRKAEMAESGAGGLMYEWRSKSMFRSKTMYDPNSE
ncbi:hypothetical protein T484DRAFT_1924757 [Baffinella frigidus]|nr:hypothetical protein T484DRAFT_1924757 [Cryptophyta sp. CCMP2293]